MTAVTRVVSTGLLEAAVPTGSSVMPARVPSSLLPFSTASTMGVGVTGFGGAGGSGVLGHVLRTSSSVAPSVLGGLPAASPEVPAGVSSSSPHAAATRERDSVRPTRSEQTGKRVISGILLWLGSGGFVCNGATRTEMWTSRSCRLADGDEEGLPAEAPSGRGSRAPRAGGRRRRRCSAPERWAPTSAVQASATGARCRRRAPRTARPRPLAVVDADLDLGDAPGLGPGHTGDDASPGGDDLRRSGGRRCGTSS